MMDKGAERRERRRSQRRIAPKDRRQVAQPVIVERRSGVADRRVNPDRRFWLRIRKVALVLLTLSVFAAIAIGYFVVKRQTATARAPRPQAALLGPVFYAAPNGSPTCDGSLACPWDLATAFGSLYVPPPAVIVPGSTLNLRGGIYRGPFPYMPQFVGTPSAQTTVRSAPGEWAVIDATGIPMTGIDINICEVVGSYTTYRDFEVRNSNWVRDTSIAGSQVNGMAFNVGNESARPGDGLKFINLIIHDVGQGFGLWRYETNVEVSGCLVYYNGWTGPDRGHGHGIYVQNQAPSETHLNGNLVWSNFSHGIQAFGTSNSVLDNTKIRDTSFWANGMSDNYQRNIEVGGGVVAHGWEFSNGVSYYPTNQTAGQNVNVGYEYGNGCTDCRMFSNLFAGGDSFISPLNVNFSMTDNTAFGPVFNATSQTAYPSNTYLPQRPAVPWIKTWVDPYAPGRGTVTIFNWPLASSLPVDISSIVAVGSSWEIRDAQNYFAGPVASGGVYGGSPVTVSMAARAPVPVVGYAAQPSTFPEFGAFVVLSSAPPPPPPTATSTSTRLPVSTATATPFMPTVTATRTAATPSPAPTKTPKHRHGPAEPGYMPTPTETP